MEGEVSGRQEPGRRSSAMTVLKEVAQGVAVGVIVGVLGSVLIHAAGLGLPPVWVSAAAGAVAAIAFSLIMQKVRRGRQRASPRGGVASSERRVQNRSELRQRSASKRLA